MAIYERLTVWDQQNDKVCPLCPYVVLTKILKQSLDNGTTQTVPT